MRETFSVLVRSLRANERVGLAAVQLPQRKREREKERERERVMGTLINEKTRLDTKKVKLCNIVSYCGYTDQPTDQPTNQ